MVKKRKEVWKSIPEFAGYSISNMGNVRSLERIVKRNKSNGKIQDKRVRERILKPAIAGQGYLFVSLRRNGRHYNKRIHKLVAENFVSGRRDGLIVHHKDGKKINNKSTNLEWTTKQKNTQDYYIKKGKSKGRIKITEIEHIINRVNSGEKCIDISKEYNVTRNDIATLCKIIELKIKDL